METKQTAIEWLFTQLDLIKLLPREKWIEARKEILERAKEMEKEQKIEFAEKMRLIQDVDFDGNITFAFDPRTHLDTFKSE